MRKSECAPSALTDSLAFGHMSKLSQADRTAD